MKSFPTGLLVLPLLLVGVFVALFLWIGSQVNSDGELVRFDHELGLSLQESRETTPILRVFFVSVTQMAAVETMAILVPLGALLFWFRGQRAASITFIACGLGVGLLNYSTKRYYDRDRPPFKDPLARETNKSYPSGHTSGSIAIFGFLIYLLMKTKLDRRSRLMMMVGLGVLIALIDFSRVYLGAHYASDVMGGTMLGSAWLTLCITAMEIGRWRDSSSP